MTHSKTPLTNNSESNLTDPYDSLLMVPGPTIVHQTVRKSMSNNQMGHLSSEFTENFRTPDSHIGFDLFDTFTRGQLLSLPMIIFGIVLIYLSLKKNNETIS